MISKSRGLGRGISALIPEETTPDSSSGPSQVSIHEIKTNPYQPRKVFSDEALEELADSIRQRGILQPLLVKKNGSTYQLIAGERRLRAAYKAGLETVPVRIIEADEKDLREIALIENLQREDLNVIEEAEGYQNLIETYNYTQEEIAERVSKSRSAVTNSLRLLKLGKNIKDALLQKNISMGHARAYLGLDSNGKQEEVHRLVIKKGLSVRQTENLIKKMREAGKSKKKNPSASSAEEAQLDFILNELQKKFSTKIHIGRHGEKGKIVIEFFSRQEFERIYDLLRD
ncbi:MAG: ParB/RepB/Spo0J family partition protein [Pseudomonadota bacterium]